MHIHWLHLLRGLYGLWAGWTFVNSMAFLARTLRRKKMQLSELAVGEAQGEFVWGNKVVHFTFDPNAYTAQAEAEWRQVAMSSWAGDMAIAFVQKLVRSWDLHGDVEYELRDATEEELDLDPDAPPQPILNTGRLVDADTPFPLDDFNKLRYLPMPFMGELVEAVQEAMTVGKAKRQRSGAGSGTAEIRRIRS